MRSGFYGTGLNFVNVTGSATKLGDLVVSGYDPSEGYAESEIMVSYVDDSGAEKDGIFYFWCDFFNEEVQQQYYGWYTEDGTCCNDLPLSIGEGMMVQAPGDWVKIQVSGQVYSQALPIQLRGGFTLIANPIPSAITLNQVTVTGYDPSEGYASSEIMLSQLDDSGAEKDGIFYFWCDFFNEEVQEQYYGWYTEDGTCYNTLSLDCGEAVMLQSPDNSFYVNFPKAL